METAEINIGKAIRCPPLLPIHLKNGINRKDDFHRVLRTRDISVLGWTMVSVPSAIESSTMPIWVRQREGWGGGWTVIDYANDQLGERSYDSSSVVNAIAVWQFATVQVHLTRFKSRSHRGTKKKKKDATGNRSGASSSHVVRPVFNGFARMEREYRQELASSPRRHDEWLDITELTRYRGAFRGQVIWDWILDWTPLQWEIIIEIIAERKTIMIYKLNC